MIDMLITACLLATVRDTNTIRGVAADEHLLGRPGYCVGWADPGRGEADLWLQRGEVRFVWGPPVEEFVSERFLAGSGSPGKSGQAARRSGIVTSVGAWLVARRVRNPIGAGGTLFGMSRWKEIANAELRRVGSHTPEVCLPLCRTLWEVGALAYQVDVLAYRDRTAVVHGHELVVSITGFAPHSAYCFHRLGSLARSFRGWPRTGGSR